MPGKAKQLGDRRIQRTRRMLREALVSLMTERGWEDITVQDVCDRADVGRSTFYTHFADKEGLLIGGFEDLRTALREPLASPASGGPLLFARGLMEHAHTHQRLFRAIVGKRSGQVVLRWFRELVVDLVKEDLDGVGAAGAQKEAAVRFIAGGFVDLLTWWLEASNSFQPPELEGLFHQMVAPAIDVVVGKGAAGKPSAVRRKNPIRRLRGKA